ncbi:hypothetical protein FNV43_RR06846 [Rhamnella rubrinervis]|uniref:ATP-dependent RNA helicase DDX11 n=1 Tax=Rhamnella rubrinervis TaxID=2594499 RepID=A0A8K0MLU1_9ROSA|nr:hypothetical protein FNV43_RR06846 [Rhamnella rubrinervis]
MLLKETIDKSKNLFHKTLQNLKSSFFGGYQKLPRSLPCNPFSCGYGKMKNCKADKYYTDFYDEWESHLDMISKRAGNATMASKDVMKEENARSESIVFPKQSPVKTKQEAGLKEKKKTGSSNLGKAKESNAQKMVNSGGFALAQKMKELEMMEAGDVEQVLDIEEALHYYSRLKSPVYVDIVDKFFTDMYSESSIPPAPVSINNSKRRFGSFRL